MQEKAGKEAQQAEDVQVQVPGGDHDQDAGQRQERAAE